MKLKLVRDVFTDLSTTGTLTINDEYFCFTLEDTDRKLEDGGEKVYGKTCIPRGTYEVIIDFSPKYNREMPHILDVPGFEGIRIHAGNSDVDSLGCILVGSTRQKDFVGNSVTTFKSLMELLEETYTKPERITLEII